MVNKVKNKFLLPDYKVSLLRKMQNLKQKDMTVKEYTKEFYRLDMWMMMLRILQGTLMD